MIKLIQVRLPDLTSEAELMFPHVIGNDVRYMPSEVASPFGRRQPNLFKSTGSAFGRRSDDDVRSAQDGLPVIGRIRTQEYAHGLGIEAVVEVMKELIEIVGAEQYLIRNF